MADTLPKVVIILGPTATGKTDLGIALAKKFNGEIISADSRQVFKKMEIGTVKPPGEWRGVGESKAYMVEGVPHYCMDIIDPGTELSMADFKTLAIAHVNDIRARGKVPFIVGGTGLYIWSVVDNLDIPKVPPHKKLRRSLEKKTLLELQIWLKKIDLEAYKVIDLKNPRRLIRALEVAILSGESFNTLRRKAPEPIIDSLQLGIHRPTEDLYRRINYRADKLVENGWIEETRSLLKQKYDWNLPSMSSLGYKQIGYYLRGEKSLEDVIASIKQDTRHYARRQMTWFKRDKRIQWMEGAEVAKAERIVKEFLKK
ncbi:MAG: tRNA (adenosine(37)-N6)-dimethylallyltransferase MiaA [Candidatus Magasanikbacteria bacterium RIFCSPHIGHO2_01_FULL_47_8]|uniref:tRNA dimethylallyltransferase n=1 Tax=Candidatus Magasanikbacteria bacterium RIFCSPHIGHO2_01_FULL_47_8 TaxID=1798673 RepID=A0A1F6MC97_9BACT|nr:MAG: tRNA (adenosine(37)-N6)-dimethylallyltransferase MiaA [Candidatus Magasanikbacteria bacterium RIFCSPHIGHO2_01_FULL_47_8]